jgi:hypothetical protein
MLGLWELEPKELTDSILYDHAWAVDCYSSNLEIPCLLHECLSHGIHESRHQNLTTGGYVTYSHPMSLGYI